ncbi:MAG: hypothetical protein ABJO54_03365 [Hyphomicrobiales bacterium]
MDDQKANQNGEVGLGGIRPAGRRKPGLFKIARTYHGAQGYDKVETSDEQSLSITLSRVLVKPY